MNTLHGLLGTVLLFTAASTAFAYEDYSGCSDCHGAFTGNDSPKGTVFPSDDKHAMHRAAANMDTECLLCHTSTGDLPLIGSSGGTANNAGLGCVGCHGREEDLGNDNTSPGRGAGLRQHHYVSGTTVCAGCHSDANPANYRPVGEQARPPYYGTIDTKANDACNLNAAAKAGENWSVGDFRGLDNDGDGRYDRADSDCAPPMASVSDTSGNAVAEFAVLRQGAVASLPGYVAEIRDGATGTLQRYLDFFDDTWTPVAMSGLGDTDSNGRPEVAVLAVRLTDGRAAVQVKNASGDQLPRLVWTSAGYSPVGMATIEVPAYNGGIARAALLSIRDSDGRGVVEVKNLVGATSADVVWLTAGFTPLGIVMAGDADGNGVPEVAVLTRRNSDGRIAVEVKNVSGSTNGNTVWFDGGYTPRAIVAAGDADANSIPDVAVLMTRNSDGRMVAAVKNVRGATDTSTVWYAEAHAPLGLLAVGDVDANSVPELGVLSTRNSDGRILVEVKNAAGATAPSDLWFSSGFTARSAVKAPDVDSNGVAEAAVLVARASDGRMAIELRNLRGAQQVRTIWLTPQ